MLDLLSRRMSSSSSGSVGRKSLIDRNALEEADEKPVEGFAMVKTRFRGLAKWGRCKGDGAVSSCWNERRPGCREGAIAATAAVCVFLVNRDWGS